MKGNNIMKSFTKAMVVTIAFLGFLPFYTMPSFAANVTRIDLRLVTGDRDNAGTDAIVYLGLGGREFRINRDGIDDLERGADEIFTLGLGSNISDSSDNDPRSPFPLLTQNLNSFPKYIRMVATGDAPGWNIEFVSVTVNPGVGQRVISGLAGGAHIWLCDTCGLIFYLR